MWATVMIFSSRYANKVENQVLCLEISPETKDVNFIIGLKNKTIFIPDLSCQGVITSI